MWGREGKGREGREGGKEGRKERRKEGKKERKKTENMYYCVVTIVSALPCDLDSKL
jgi:hypothetical protein